VRAFVLVLIATLAVQVLAAQSSSPPAFDVVSIKRNLSESFGGLTRTAPDGTTVLANLFIRAIVTQWTTERVRDIENLPDWASERYDVIVKPPEATNRSDIPAMWRTMLADRFKMQAHVEQREKDGFVLMPARSDGRLGPNLTPSTLDCTPRPSTTPGPSAVPTREVAAAQCGFLVGQGFIVSGSLPIAAVAQFVEGLVGMPVVDGTELDGSYRLELAFSTPRVAATVSNAIDPAASPDIAAASQEQLGLKLQREKVTVPVLVIDHIERPTEN